MAVARAHRGPVGPARPGARPGGGLSAAALLVVGCAPVGPATPAPAEPAAPLPDTILWHRTLGVPGTDVGGSIAEASDGGWLVVGSVRPAEGRDDIRLVRLGVGGDTLWSRTCCGTGTERTATMSVVPADDGGWVVGGMKFVSQEVGLQVLLLGIDSIGRERWTRTYGGEGRDALESIRRTRDGGYVVAGATALPGSDAETPWLLRLDRAGDTLWTRTWPGPGNGATEAALEMPDGGFITAGTRGDREDYPIDWTVRRLTADGETVWDWVYGGPRRHVYPEWLALAGDGGVLVVGTLCEPCYPAVRPYDDSFDGFATRLDARGDTLWTRRLGGARNDLLYFVVRTSRGTFLAGGATTPPGGAEVTPWLVELDDGGRVVWSRTLPDAFPGNGVAQILEVAPDEFLVTGPPWLYQSRRDGSQGLWALRIHRASPGR